MDGEMATTSKSGAIMTFEVTLRFTHKTVPNWPRNLVRVLHGNDVDTEGKKVKAKSTASPRKGLASTVTVRPKGAAR